MALKVTRKTPGQKKPRVSRPRKSLLIAATPRKIIVQDYATDQFGELAARKREAEAKARTLGHDLMPWHQRSNDPTAGRWNAFCTSCNQLAVVCTEAPVGFPWIYGHAFTDTCQPVGDPIQI